MTVADMTAIENLRIELHDYHLEVQQYNTRGEACSKKTEKHDKTLYGNGRAGLVGKVWLLMGILGILTSIGIVAIGGWICQLLSQ